MKKYVLASLLLAGTIHATRAQLCGGGDRYVRIQAVPQEPPIHLNYEAFALSDSVAYTLPKHIFEKSQPDHLNRCATLEIAPAVARQLIVNIRPDWRQNIRSVSAGVVTGNVITLPTTPAGNLPILIKIFSAKQELYILSTFFCTCHDPIQVYWSSSPKVARN
jgi:hypothetical protein